MKIPQLFIGILLVLISLTACGQEPSPPPTEVLIPTATFTPNPPTPTPTPIVHTMIPGEPKYLLAQLITDCTIGRGVTIMEEEDDGSFPVVLSNGCDRWDYNKIERPFIYIFTNYTPQIDISTAQVGYDEDWFFAQAITYYGEFVEPQPMNGTYGIEIDPDLDGRGNIIILASQPGEEWGVAGVQVWRDNDTTVGADTPIVADKSTPDGGYEEIIFNAGVGDDPDLAWARISPTDPNIVQIAFKRSLAGEKGQFGWMMWAGMIDFVPADFDIVDTFLGHELYELDNTCSWTYGAPPQDFPNQCGYDIEKYSGCYVKRRPDPQDCFSGQNGHWQWSKTICEWVCVKGLP